MLETMPNRAAIWNFLFGRLTLDSLPFLANNAEGRILLVTLAVVVIIGVAILAAVTKYRKWGYLWHEWFTSVDHKKLGIMYMILGPVILLPGFSAPTIIPRHRAYPSGP